MRRLALCRAALLALALLPAAAAHAAEPHNYCSEKGRDFAVLIDVTTPYDEIDKRALVDGIGAIFEALKGGDRLSIRTIEDAFPKSARLVDACMPYCPEQGLWGDLFSECTEGVVINDKKALRRTIAESLGHRLSGATELPRSEIIRTIAMKLPEDIPNGRETTIYLFSDMIENSVYLPGAQFFATPNSKIVEQLDKDKLIPNLLGAKVTVVGIGRGGSTARTPLDQTKLVKLEEFWRLFFAATGATATLK